MKKHVLVRPDVQDLMHFFPEIDLLDSLDGNFESQVARFLGDPDVNLLMSKIPENHYRSTHTQRFDLVIPEIEKDRIKKELEYLMGKGLDKLVDQEDKRSSSIKKQKALILEELTANVIALRSAIRLDGEKHGLSAKKIPCTIQTYLSCNRNRKSSDRFEAVLKQYSKVAPEPIESLSDFERKDVKKYNQLLKRMSTLKSQIEKLKVYNKVLTNGLDISVPPEISLQIQNGLKSKLDELEARLDAMAYFAAITPTKNKPTVKNQFIQNWIPKLSTFFGEKYLLTNNGKPSVNQQAIIGFLFSELDLGPTIGKRKLENRERELKEKLARWTDKHFSRFQKGI